MKLKRDFIYDPSLVLYLPLYELDAGAANGNSFMSSDRYGHRCTVTGATWKLDGRDFSGTDQYITIPRAASIEPQSFTLLIWIKLDTIGASGSVMFSKDQTSHIVPYYSYHFRANGVNSTLHFEWNDGTTNQSLDGSSLTTGVWTHLAVTFTSGSQIVYKNAVSVLSGTRADTITYYARDLFIGASLNLGGNYDVDGIIGEAAILSRALTVSDVQEHYRATKWRYR